MSVLRSIAVGTAFVATASLGVVMAQPASAVSCVPGLYASTTYDYARITDVSGGCGQIGVRHHFNVPNAPVSAWTSWYFTTGSAVQTPITRELDSAQYSY